MQYIITLKKKSPAYHLWASNGYQAANLMGVLFKWQKATRDYVAVGTFNNLAQLARSPYLIIEVLGKATGEVKVDLEKLDKDVEKDVTELKDEVEKVEKDVKAGVKGGFKKIAQMIERTAENLEGA